ncbi:type III-A CRISPR-associated protein Cas10/Csm1 [Rivularia sp. UHCC 0363]|uniref:type III-A CRISPR-associated protein Cas10/Csm1 n=1 Tax=Rivularia sp. UHCC 0363 TaxID=3110244 RepID=UPI002B1F0A9A|nr:type III-A CRISPR-associated protein Cas10/Csm1 [Rivularia sp. UHCC 0363]MEA5593482.1 type III-A CRISPR-associated protein Cas10/Csm1 [Rivularia sp. UHCC 0363]
MINSGAYHDALQVVREGVCILAKWANAELTNKCPPFTETDAVKRAKNILSWDSNYEIKPLQCLFDSVKLSCGQDKIHYWYPQAIADKSPLIPYPQDNEPVENDFDELKQEIEKAINSLNQKDWENLSLLTLILEKYGSFISFGNSDVALIDIVKSTAAVAGALANNLNANQLTLVAGDLSGIQKFIYTISSDGALKSLRARSFYLELVTEEVVQQVLQALELPRTNVIYAGGGKLYILAAETEKIKDIVEEIRQQFNKWLLKEFQGKVFLALDCLSFPIKDIGTQDFAENWASITKCLSKQKTNKFSEQITDFIQPQNSYEPCKVCHRDDVENLKQLNSKESDSVLACATCRRMFELGGQLLKLDSIVRSSTENLADDKTHKLSFKLPATDRREAVSVYYYLFENWKPIVNNSETVFLINDWDLKHYQFSLFRNPIPLLLGNYGKETEKPEEKGFMRANEMAEKAKEVGAIPRVGYLRMDVDRLGIIFAEGLGDKKNLARIGGLSRQMSYFFKVYLNSLAEFRKENTPKNIEKLKPEDERLNLLFIYAGGDDLFVSGAWNEVVEFGFDVYQCFRAFTGNNPDITLSAGISLAEPKFPLYQAADTSGDAEKAAKGNGKDSLGLFGQIFKWDEWLGIKHINLIDSEIKAYLQPESVPNLLGILPFVERLEKQEIGSNYSRNFVRNLLTTAEIQEQALDKFKDQKSQGAMGTRYFLHLPKVAYTLARLPTNVLDDVDFRTSLKSPYNAPYFRAIATWIELLNRSKL